MATSYVDVLLQLFDDYGVVLAGGTIATYEAGTTTPLASYQDLEGATPNENPVVLDAAGRAVIRFTNGVAYKIVVKDSSGNLILTRDNIIIGTADGTTTEIYPVHMTFCGGVDAGGFMGGWIMEDAVTFPANFSGAGLNASGSIKINPTDTFIVSVQLNGSEVGTITVDTDGLFSFASDAEWSAVKYDQIDFIGPEVADATAADFTILLLATVDQ